MRRRQEQPPCETFIHFQEGQPCELLLGLESFSHSQQFKQPEQQ